MCNPCAGHDDVDDDDDDFFKEFAVGDLDDDSQDIAAPEKTEEVDASEPANGKFVTCMSSVFIQGKKNPAQQT